MIGSLEGASVSALTMDILEDPAPFLPGWSSRCASTGSWRSSRTGHASAQLHEADVTYRARQLALGGAELLFADLHPIARMEATARWS